MSLTSIFFSSFIPNMIFKSLHFSGNKYLCFCIWGNKVSFYGSVVIRIELKGSSFFQYRKQEGYKKISFDICKSVILIFNECTQSTAEFKICQIYDWWVFRHNLSKMHFSNISIHIQHTRHFLLITLQLPLYLIHALNMNIGRHDYITFHA